MKADIYSASDYAGFRSKFLECYYGYEKGYCPTCNTYNDNADGDCPQCGDSNLEWCFYAKGWGERGITIPFSKLGLKPNDQNDTNKCLLKGIAWLFEGFYIERNMI